MFDKYVFKHSQGIFIILLYNLTLSYFQTKHNMVQKSSFTLPLSQTRNGLQIYFTIPCHTIPYHILQNSQNPIKEKVLIMQMYSNFDHKPVTISYVMASQRTSFNKCNWIIYKAFKIKSCFHSLSPTYYFFHNKAFFRSF